LEELQALVQQLMEDLNHKEISQAIGTSPSERLDGSVAKFSDKSILV
ncbi:hypothetical protein GJI86_12270, partial [Lactococcus lactis subsp. cremoris MG1363]|nr:hypothetical protein [Lactococcus cremoris subsp. cremoris MG1363]